MSDQYEVVAKGLNELREFLEKAPTLLLPGMQIVKHRLFDSENVACVYWDNQYLISGADILRCIVFKFRAFGREIVNRAKFEELIFSDLRSSKSSVRARLEEGKSELLKFLHDNGCIRTKKKQRVFYWQAIPHDELFLDSLERELRRAVVDSHNPESNRITVAVREPATTIQYDPLAKVVYQIPKIMAESNPAHLPILSSLFGIPLDTSTQTRPGTQVSQPFSRLPFQELRSFPGPSNARLRVTPQVQQQNAGPSTNMSETVPVNAHESAGRLYSDSRPVYSTGSLQYSANMMTSEHAVVYPFTGSELIDARPFPNSRTGMLRSSDFWLAPPEAADIRRDVWLPPIHDVLPLFAQYAPSSASSVGTQNSSIVGPDSAQSLAFSASSPQNESEKEHLDQEPPGPPDDPAS